METVHLRTAAHARALLTRNDHVAVRLVHPSPVGLALFVLRLVRPGCSAVLRSLTIEMDEVQPRLFKMLARRARARRLVLHMPFTAAAGRAALLPLPARFTTALRAPGARVSICGSVRNGVGFRLGVPADEEFFPLFSAVAEIYRRHQGGESEARPPRFTVAHGADGATVETLLGPWNGLGGYFELADARPASVLHQPGVPIGLELTGGQRTDIVNALEAARSSILTSVVFSTAINANAIRGGLDVLQLVPKLAAVVLNGEGRVPAAGTADAVEHMIDFVANFVKQHRPTMFDLALRECGVDAHTALRIVRRFTSLPVRVTVFNKNVHWAEEAIREVRANVVADSGMHLQVSTLCDGEICRHVIRG
jgi:hypothetical protein